MKVLTAKVSGDIYELSWYVGSNKALWSNILTKVKMIPGRTWDPTRGKKGCWVCPINPRTSQLIGELGFKIKGEKVKEDRPKVIAIPPTAWKDEVVRDMTDKARNYQVDGVKMMQAFNFNCLIADQAGSGKTLQSLSAVRTSETYPVLIICPSTLKLNWKREIKMWGDPRYKNSYYIVQGRKKQNFKNYKYVIINYDILYDHVKYITKEFKPKLAIIDEAHELSGRAKVVSKYYPDYKMKGREFVAQLGDRKVIVSRPPKRVEAALWILNGFSEAEARHAGYLWEGISKCLPMTATPMPNNAGDIYNILKILDKDRFNDEEKFLNYFCEREEGFKPGILVIKKSKNMDKLNKLLIEEYMIRRLKKDILPELPDRIKTVVPQLMSDKDWKDYQKADEDFVQWIAENKGKKIYSDEQERSARFQVLQELALKGKIKACFKFIDGILEEKDKKVVLFAHHKDTINQIMERYGSKAVKLVGGMTDTKKQESVDAFQNNKKITVFAGNLRAASVGITLTRSSTVIFIEFGYLPHFVDQGIDRCHRIGSEGDKVNAFFLPAAGTIEKMIMIKLDQKLSDMEAGIDGKETDESEMLEYLWKEYEEKANKLLTNNQK